MPWCVDSIFPFAVALSVYNRGTLLWLLDHTKTNFGRRLLRTWVLNPMVDVDDIRNRQSAVCALCTLRGLYTQVLIPFGASSVRMGTVLYGMLKMPGQHRCLVFKSAVLCGFAVPCHSQLTVSTVFQKISRPLHESFSVCWTAPCTKCPIFQNSCPKFATPSAIR